MVNAFQAIMMVLLWGLLGIVVFKIVIEPIYVMFFNKPIYIHYYFRMRKLDTSQCVFLEKNCSFYNKLADREKEFFNHRVARFIRKYQFIGKDEFVVTEEVKLLLAAIFVMLTFGMRHYLINNFNKIIIYPENYYSVITKQYHKGEFNPRFKALVFSWKDFQEGLRYGGDNLNLGLHEFSHALYFHGLRGRDQSSVVFSDSYDKIKAYLNRPEILNQLIASNYFRIYAYTNQVEFFAVLLEHFFETPEQFQKEFPELFSLVSEMINFKELVHLNS